MEKLLFDNGLKEYDVNGTGVLRFNPSDPNVYGRFLDAVDEIKTVENDLIKRGKALSRNDGEGVVRLMVEADKKVKTILKNVFGSINDFDAIFGGVNIMAVASNGERVITNFMVAIEPIVSSGAEKCAQQKVNDAVAAAKNERAQRYENA
jgi:hypothetical protein